MATFKTIPIVDQSKTLRNVTIDAVYDESNNVDVIDQSPVVELTAMGLPGPRGPQGTQGIQGVQGIQGPSGPATNAAYVHIQNAPSAIWHIIHNLGFFPSVNVVDSAGAKVEGDIIYIDTNKVDAVFSAGFGGTAYLS